MDWWALIVYIAFILSLMALITEVNVPSALDNTCAFLADVYYSVSADFPLPDYCKYDSGAAVYNKEKTPLYGDLGVGAGVFVGRAHWSD